MYVCVDIYESASVLVDASNKRKEENQGKNKRRKEKSKEKRKCVKKSEFAL